MPDRREFLGAVAGVVAGAVVPVPVVGYAVEHSLMYDRGVLVPITAEYFGGIDVSAGNELGRPIISIWRKVDGQFQYWSDSLPVDKTG